MLKAGFEIIPLDKVRQNSNILVGSRYREPVTIVNKTYDFVRLGDVATFIRGVSFPKNAQKTSDKECLRVVTTKAAQVNGIDFDSVLYIDRSYLKQEKMLTTGDILISLANSLGLVGRVTYVDDDYKDLTFGAFMGLIRVDHTKINSAYLFSILQSEEAKNYFKSVAKTTTNISNLTFEDLSELLIPLPNIETQTKIVSEIDGYRQAIKDANQIINNYNTKIRTRINEVWVE